MKIEVWSDFVCPYCYIGKRRIEKVMEDLEINEDVEWVYKSFELNPDSPKVIAEGADEHLAHKYNLSLEKAHEANMRVIGMANEIGLSYNLKNMKPTNTHDAHRLMHLAMEEKVGTEVAEKIYHAHFVSGEPIWNPNVLMHIGTLCGISREKIEQVLLSDAYTKQVHGDEEEAYDIPVNLVPHYVIDGEIHIEGDIKEEEYVKAFKSLKAYDKNIK